MFSTLLSLLLAHKALILSTLGTGVTLFLQKKPGAKSVLEHVASVVNAADEFLDALPGINTDSKKK